MDLYQTAQPMPISLETRAEAIIAQTPVRVALPYPPLQVAVPNPRYARAMLDNIGGSNSEMTAVASYFYDQLVLQERYPEIAAIYRQIDQVEMHHLDIFGQLARQLGAEPRLWTRLGKKYQYWTPAYSSYGAELPILLKNSISTELAAIEKYQYQAAHLGDPALQDILDRIVVDEQRHVEIFRLLYEAYVEV